MVPERFVVAGGSIAGLASGLALARAGATVTVVERDEIPLAADPDEAFAIERPGVPQSHFLHAFLARMVLELRQRFPDVLDDLVAAGARIERPPTIVDDSGDLALLLARRSTVEWVLRRALLAEPGVELLAGCGLVGVTGDQTAVGPPRVTGAVLDDGTTLAGTVVACTGRRADVAAWLRPLGVEITEQLVQSELVYITRWYAADDFPMPTTGLLRDLGFLSYLVLPADGGTLAVGVGIHPADRELRACLLDDDGFDTVASLLPDLGASLAAASARPLRSSRPMAGLVNRLRRYVDDRGEPLVLGLHAVGDAHTCTNPAYGRGCSLALVQAGLLADAVAAHPADAVERSRAYEAACAREIEPWFHSSVFMDQARADLQQRAVAGEKPSAGGPDLLRVFAALASGTLEDPVIIGGFARLLHLLVTPDELFADPAFGARLLALMANPPEVPRAPAGPTREELLQAASAAA